MSQTQIPNILSLLTFLPLIGALIVMFLPRPIDLPEHHGGHGDEAHGEPELDAPVAPTETDFGRMLVNGVSLFFAGATLLLSLVLFGAFQIHNSVGSSLQGVAQNMQFVEDYRWIAIGNSYVHYKMGVDGISLLLVVLTTFLMVLCVLYSTKIKTRLKEFMVFLLLLEAAMIGVFCALDLVLFYIFFEAMLIPMYFLIGIFGHENRIYAAVKFFIYTFAGSVFMLIAIVAVYSYTGTFDILALSDHTQGAGRTLNHLSPHVLMPMFAAFAVAFMIKVPMFPFHTWLPDAHVEAPTAGSVILAGVMLKMGTYGFVRLCLPLFPQQARDAAPVFIVLSIVGIIYASLVAAVQPDAKKLVAYSSVAHLGFVVLSIFTFTPRGHDGRACSEHQSRHFHAHAVLHRGHDVRAAAYAGHQRVRRAEALRADDGDDAAHRHAGERGRAVLQRVCGRVPGFARNVDVAACQRTRRLLARCSGRNGHDLVGSVHAVVVSAADARPHYPSREPPSARSDRD